RDGLEVLPEHERDVCFDHGLVLDEAAGAAEVALHDAGLVDGTGPVVHLGDVRAGVVADADAHEALLLQLGADTAGDAALPGSVEDPDANLGRLRPLLLRLRRTEAPQARQHLVGVWLFELQHGPERLRRGPWQRRNRDGLEAVGVVGVDFAERPDELVDVAAAQGVVGLELRDRLVGDVVCRQRALYRLTEGFAGESA